MLHYYIWPSDAATCCTLERQRVLWLESAGGARWAGNYYIIIIIIYFPFPPEAWESIYYGSTYR